MNYNFIYDSERDKLFFIRPDESLMEITENADVQQEFIEVYQAINDLRQETTSKELFYSAFPVETASGAIVSITDGADDVPLKSCVVTMLPIQNLHGYDKPWEAGAGKNLLEITRTETYTQKGITFVVNRDSNGVPVSITCTGTSTEDNSFYNLNYTPGVLSIPKGTAFKVSGGKDGVVVQACLPTASTTARSQDGNASSSFTVPESAESSWVRVEVRNAGTTVNTTIYPMLVLATETDYTFEPYSNICPITGHTEGTVYVSETTSEDDATSYHSDFPSTVYGGDWNVTEGEIAEIWQIIDSYDGETLPDIWISDRDVYSSESTPTTGAQVCYKLATPQSISVDPHTIPSLLGDNNIWSDAGDIAVTYRADIQKYIAKQLEGLTPAEDDEQEDEAPEEEEEEAPEEEAIEEAQEEGECDDSE